MEDNKKKDISSELIEIIKDDAIVKMDVGFGFYKDMQVALQVFLKDKSSEEIKKAHKEFKENKFTEDWIFAYNTIAAFLNQFQELVKSSNQTEKITKEEYISKFGEKEN